MPAHPASLPAMLAMHSDFSSPGSPPSTISGGSISYTGLTPWFGFGSANGYHPPATQEYPAIGSFTYNVPSWANYLDVAILGGGGGGRAGDPFGGNGEGGHGGGWATATLTRGAELATSATTAVVTVGGGGAGGTFNPASNPGSNGGASSISCAAEGGGTTNVIGAAGLGGTLISPSRDLTGQSPGNVTYNGITYYGGGAQTVASSPGNAPGGGGSGGSSWNAGTPAGSGAGGVVWITARQS